MKPLRRKQSAKNDEWIAVSRSIEDSVSRSDIEKLAKDTVKEIKTFSKGKKVAYAWSGGKDSIVLAELCRQARVTLSMCGICDLEYPAFEKWIRDHAPEGCVIINTKQDIKWLANHQGMLFPQNSQKAARWFSIVQHRAQQKFFEDNELDAIILGRRKADGNYVGANSVYTNRMGVTRYSPMADWKHEDVLAYIHYFKLELPPIYDWKNGYLCGTHPWPARQWTGSIENGWREIYDIDAGIVIKASEYIESAKAFLKEVQA